MKVVQVGKYSLIMTAKRKGLAWHCSARLKPSSPAPEPFSEYGTYTAKMTGWTESAAYANLQKEVMRPLREFAERSTEADLEELG